MILSPGNHHKELLDFRIRGGDDVVRKYRRFWIRAEFYRSENRGRGGLRFSMDRELRSSEYTDVLIRIKEDIRNARVRAFSAVNRELMELYWQVGQVILAKSAWGSGFAERLSKDIRYEFPDLKGFSVRNLWYMRKFAEEFPDAEIVQTLSAEISWSHTTMLLDKVTGVPV